MIKDFKGVKVTDLLKDGIALERDDIVVLKEHNTYSLRIGYGVNIKYPEDFSNWLGSVWLENYNSGGEFIFENWYVVEFAERNNITGEQPVPDWVAVKYNYSVLGVTQGIHEDLAGKLSWELDEWEYGEWWKPDLVALMEHYANKASDEQNKEETETSKVIISEDENYTEDSLTEAAVYTKDMFDKGILPEEGMLHNGEEIVNVRFRQTAEGHPQVLVDFKNTGSYCLSNLSFEKSYEDKAKELYYNHMKLNSVGYEYMWDQCSDKYKQAWITIASNGKA